jgi:hypothetical protein
MICSSLNLDLRMMGSPRRLVYERTLIIAAPLLGEEVMNKLDRSRRAQIIAALVEGTSIRATSRMVGVSKDTVMKLLVDVGKVCAEYQDRAFRNLPCKRVQCDEIWSFCHAKEKNVSPEHKGVLGYGDVWTWTAIDADTKLIPCWHIGRRDGRAAYEFITDLASRLASRVQLTTDGHRPYLEAVEAAFGCEVDYAMLVKIYGKPQEEIRYSPPQILDIKCSTVSGNPDPAHISTSNAFSKKLENHMHATALHYMYYNFARIHKSLRCSPAMACGRLSEALGH